MMLRATTALLFIFAIVACAQEPDAPQVGQGGAIDTITAAAIQRHLIYLADDAREGRMAGQPGYDAAAQYVADHFASLGLEPAGDDGWYQQVPLISYRLIEESAAVVAHRDGKDIALLDRQQFVMSGDQVSPEDNIRGGLVYVGYGVHAPEFGYSDYDGIDVEGKIVALFSRAPASLPHNERAYYSSSLYKSREAADRGAIGTITLLSRYTEEYYPWERITAEYGVRPGMAWVTIDGDAANDVPELRGAAMLSVEAAHELFAGTPISFTAARDAAEASTPSSTPLGFEVTLARKSRHEVATSPNVVGIVRGTDPELTDEYVVYSAHLDHNGVGAPVDGDAIYNGAYDNAMGTAIMLETARAFAAAPPRRSILFVAVTAEERGLLGSDYFANHPTVPTASMVANVNLDMPLFLYPLADMIAFGAEHSSLEQTVADAISNEGFALTPDPMPQETIFIRSDQYSFVRKGVPAVFLVPGYTSSDPEINGEELVIDFRKNHYHRPSDDRGRPVDWDSALRFTRANARIGYAIADEDDRPTWNEGDFFGEKFGRAER
jgi:Zn-dependent M28 family amino/carboxypeptidase